MSTRQAVTDAKTSAGRGGPAQPEARTPRRSASGIARATATPQQLILQAKLRVGAANDPLEAEADRLAAQFVSWQQQAGVPALAAGSLTDATPRVGRAALVDTMGAFDTSDDVEQRIGAARGKGAGLPGPMKERFEGFFGADLSGVRVHRGAESADLNRAVSARAFTTGNDVFLGEGESMSGAEGERLMAHELTHVVQQSGGGMQRTIRREGEVATLGSRVADGVDASGEGIRTVNSGMNRGKGVAELSTGKKPDAKGLEESGAALGLAGSLLGLFTALRELFAARENDIGEERVSRAVEAVASAGDLLKSSVGVAVAAGAELGQMVPGVGLALSCLGFLMHVTKIIMLHRASAKEQAAIAAAADPDKKAALNTLHGRTLASLAIDYMKLVGDVYLIAGGATELTPFAPLGPAIKMIGMTVHLVSGFTSWVVEHFEAKATDKARADYAAADANKAADPAKFAKVKTDRLGVDISFAVHELLETVTAAPDADPSLDAVLAGYGIGSGWMGRYQATTDEGAKARQKVEAEEVIMRFLQADSEPQKLQDRLGNAITKAKDFVLKLFGKDKTTEIRKATVARTQMVAAERISLTDGLLGVTCAEMTRELAPTYAALKQEHAPTSKSDDKRAKYLQAIDRGMTDAVVSALNMATDPEYDAATVSVTDGVVTYAAPKPKPVAAAASASAAGALSVPTLIDDPDL